jgi:hypothetical protein
MRRVTQYELRYALSHGQRIDGSKFVLRQRSKPKNRPQQTSSPFISAGILAPFEQAAFQVEEPHGHPAHLCLYDFETLSLAARAVLAHTPCRGIGLAEGDPGDLFPVVDTGDLLAVISEAVGYLDLTGPFGEQRPPRPGDKDISEAAQLRTALRAGLQIVGCRISDLDGACPNLGLANLRIPFSLRFVGCVIDSPIVANHCELQTLDLSGSAVAGLDAASLYARGNVRLRRTTMISPANFGGARVGGVFDATDSVMQPRGNPPRDEAFAAERGMLNLGLANFENDVYLNRARIWGGLNLRGAVIARSLFLNRALIRSPVAILERLGCEVLTPLLEKTGRQLKGLEGLDIDKSMSAIEELIEDNAKLVEYLHPGPETPALKLRRKAETIGRTDFEDGASGKRGKTRFQPALRQLLSDSMRARTSAIRADSLAVEGNIFARNLKTMGRIRLKYARIGAGLHLEGARLRSVAAIGRVLDTFPWIAKEEDPKVHEALLRYHNLRISARTTAKGHDPQKDDDFALDLQEATFGGSVMLSSHADTDKAEAPSQGAQRRMENGGKPHRRPTRIDGVIAADRVRIRGDLVLVQAEFVFPPKRSYNDSWKDKALDFPPAKGATEADIAAWEATAKRIAMDWGERLRREHDEKIDLDFGGRTPTSLRLSNAEIEGDLDLRESDNLFGLDFENGKLSGSLIFANKIGKGGGRPVGDAAEPEPHASPAPELQPAGQEAPEAGTTVPPDKAAQSRSIMECERRALRVTESIILRNSQIGGDAIVVFSPTYGPKIKAEFTRIEGRLDIYPQFGAGPEDLDRNSFRMDFETFERANFEARKLRWEERLKLRKANARAIDRPTTPYIDLRNARAEAFCHPPPAWPRQGGLSLEGFNYARSHPAGPLAPHPFPDGPSLVENRLRQRDEIEQTYRVIIERPARLIVFWMIVLLVAGLFWVPKDSLPEAIRGVWVVLFHSGWWNFGAVAALLVLWFVLRASSEGYPSPRRSKPMAIPYLARQMYDTNRYRTPGRIYWSVDPYVRAASALREEGRAISANAVEAARLRHRTEMLSWRHHFLTKLGMLGVGWLANYGFDVARTVFVMAFVVLAASMTARAAHDCGRLVYQSERPTTETSGVEPGSPTPWVIPARGSDPDPEPRFVSLWYGASVVVPFLALDDYKAWKVAVPSSPPPGCEAWPRALTTSWKPFFAMLGLLLTTIIAVAVSTRVQSAFNRVQE